MSDPSSEETRERLLVESFLKLSGEHSVTHDEPLQPVVMQPVKAALRTASATSSGVKMTGSMGVISAH
ncbi:unnamed protein product [Parnassius apollo]|uniref:(apollo) hypothetical protein n=1 Tax=Parnassius apollo TaxID=110799 RepID=A0A8S3WQD9_PARAO|nr:unnamed protein product [Parnassius apollo]